MLNFLPSKIIVEAVQTNCFNTLLLLQVVLYTVYLGQSQKYFARAIHQV